MTNLGRLARTLIFLAVTTVLVASVAFGAAPVQPQQSRWVNYRLYGEIVQGQAANLTELIRVAKLAGITDLVIDIDSPGGSANEGLRLYHAIKTAGIRTTCRAGELVASAAFLAFQACDRRLVYPTSTLLTHRVYGIVQSPIITPELAAKMAVELAAIAAQMDSLIATRLGLSMKDYLEKVSYGRDWTMTGLEAIAAHAADDVAGTTKPPSLAKTKHHATVSPQ